MNTTTPQSATFVRLANQHAAELRTLATAIEVAVAQHGEAAVVASLTDKVPAI